MAQDIQKSAERVISDFETAPNYAANYLRTFFLGEPVPDDQALMKFLATEYAKLEHAPVLLEVGCGPVINHILSAAPHVSAIDMADYRADNLEEISKWRARTHGAHDWSKFIRFALASEGKKSDQIDVLAREDLTRGKIRNLRRCDLRQPTPLGSPVSYAAVSCFYTTEQASSNLEEWQRVFANLANLVEAGGTLLCCAVGFTDHYILYDATGTSHRYPVPYLTPDNFAAALIQNGFDMSRSTVHYTPLSGQETEGVYGVILVSARKLG